jgi:hypothetical protein
MKTLMKQFKPLIFFCFFMAGAFAEETPSSLSRQLKPYERYFRAGTIDTRSKNMKPTPAGPRTAARGSVQTAAPHATDPSPFSALNQEHMQLSFELMESNVELFRFFLEYLDSSAERPLPQVREKVIQLKHFVGSTIEQMTLLRQSSDRTGGLLEELLRQFSELSISTINTDYYNQFLTIKNKILFEKNTFHFYISELTKQQIDVFTRLLSRLEDIASLIADKEEENWTRSSKSLLLSTEPSIIAALKKNSRITSEEFSSLKQRYQYADTQISLERDRTTVSQFPVTRSLNHLEKRDLDQEYSRLKLIASNNVEQEKLQLSIVEANLSHLKQFQPPSLELSPLSRHLFFKHTFLVPPEGIKERTSVVELPDWI